MNKIPSDISLKACNLEIIYSLFDNLKQKYKNDSSNALIQQLKLFEEELELPVEKLFQLESLKNVKCKFQGVIPLSWNFSCILYHCLLTIVTNMKTFGEEIMPPLSMKNVENITVALHVANQHGLTPYLHDSLRPQELFKKEMKLVKETATMDECYMRLRGSLNVLHNVLNINGLILKSSIEYFHMEYAAGLICLLEVINSRKISLDESDAMQETKLYKERLDNLYEISTLESNMKIFLLLKSFPGITDGIAKILHSCLQHLLYLPGGFKSLCVNIIETEDSGTSSKPLWVHCEVISKIVGHKGHSKTFYPFIVDEIVSLMKSLIPQADRQSKYIDACVSSLDSLYSLPYKELKVKIEKHFVGLFWTLSQPEDLLTGLIIYNSSQFFDILKLNRLAFLRSSIHSLKSSILLPVLPILFHLYNMLPDNSESQNEVFALIIHCLKNRDKNELGSILATLLWDDKIIKEMKQIHPRVTVICNERDQNYSIQIGAETKLPTSLEVSDALIKILKKSNNNILIYNIFLKLLNLFEECLEMEVGSDDSSQMDLLDAEDAVQIITLMYRKRCVLITLLAELVGYRPFHFQFSENPKEILHFMRNILLKRLARPKKADNTAENVSDDQQTSLLILSIFHEFMANQTNPEINSEITKMLNEFRQDCESSVVKQQINSLIDEIESNSSTNVCQEKSKYLFARSLCDEKEPHLRVYGLTELMKLIKSKDPETLSNLHPILALALHCLKEDEDSYAFLTCIRLLVTLTKELEAVVIESLIYEFQDLSADIDYRLKCGETIVKITEGLEQFSYKYKDLLINCFVKGSSNEKDEFRTSSLFNLGNICRLLAYQVHHFFQELINLIQSIIQNDKYLPARRAAVMILSQLLRGIDNLIDFQDYLLPIYRLLKIISFNDNDQATRIHATVGLETMDRKMKEILFPEPNFKKEINILGVKSRKDSDDDDNDHLNSLPSLKIC